jgi:DeoR/GlpR family transcriptional regulator of sugar metabolism
MLGVDRRKKISEMLKEQGSVTVSELSELFNVNMETVRRDLHKMEKDKQLVRTYGGAYIIGNVHADIPIFIREVTYLEGKDQIGKICAGLIENGDTIILDSSTTSLHIAEHIKDRKNIIVLTNAIKIALKLADAKGIKVISTGGTLRPSSLSYVGYVAVNALNGFFADKAFVSCTGVDLNNGLTDSSEQEAEIRMKMLKQAKKKILIADNTKFGNTSFAQIAKLDTIDCVVTDKPLSKEWEKEFIQKNIPYFFDKEI